MRARFSVTGHIGFIDHAATPESHSSRRTNANHKSRPLDGTAASCAPSGGEGAADDAVVGTTSVVVIVSVAVSVGLAVGEAVGSSVGNSVAAGEGVAVGDSFAGGAAAVGSVV